MYIFDLDGTLLDNNGVLKPYTIKVINNLLGIKVIATCRTLSHVKEIANALNINNIIFSNGGGININDKIIYNYLPKKIVKELISNIVKIDKYANIYLKNKNINYINDYKHYNKIEKITIKSNKTNIIIKYLDTFKNISYVKLNNGELIISKTNKYLETEKIRTKYNIKKEEVIAFGDDYSDYEMINNYYGIVPMNACEELKKVCKVIVLDNHQEGIAKYIDNHIINKIKTEIIKGSASDIITDYNRRSIIKTVSINNEGINNGYTKLFYEIKHMQLFNREKYKLYPDIHSIKEKNNKLICEMEYLYEGITLRDVLKSNISINVKENIVNKIIFKLFDKLYLPKSTVYANDNYINDNHLNRAKERLIMANEQAKNKNFKILLSIMNNGLEINGVKYQNYNYYLELIENDKLLLSRLKIKNNTESHQDLIPSNIIVDYLPSINTIQDFKLIDPRGELDTGVNNRHYIYDMGKLLFGLSGFDYFRMIEENTYTLNYCEKDNYYSFKYELNENNLIVSSYLNIYKYLWKLFADNKYQLFADINIINNYELMFKLAESTCFISDIPCRINNNDSEYLTILLYIRGILTINEFFQMKEEKRWLTME